MKTNKELIVGLLIGLVVCIIVACVFAMPALKGKSLDQGDITQYKGSAQETQTYLQKEGKEILWTNSMFSGMPNYVVAAHYNGNIFQHIHMFAQGFLPHPVSYIFLLLLNFFILLLVMRVNPIAALTGAVAFAFSTYFIVIMAAGHNAKVDAIIWLPGVFAGLYMAYRRNMWLGAALFGLYFAIEITASHPQMVYYFGFLAIAFVIVEIIGLIIENKAVHAIKTSAILAVIAALAIGTSWSYLKTTNNYAQYSIRGKSELTSNAENKTSGLDRDYVTQWSNGIGETWSLLVPNFKGGASDDLSRNKTAMGSVSGQEKQMLKGMPAYWGDQPSTGGPVYVGAGIFFLFLFSLFFVKDRIKWALLIAGLFTLMMSWGKNFNGFTNFMLDHFPLYSKFRAVLSAIVVPEFIIPLLAILGLSFIISNPDSMKKKATIFGNELSFTNQAVYFSTAGFVIFILLMMFIAPGMFTSFSGASDLNVLAQLQSMGLEQTQIDQIMGTVETARLAVFRADVLRSLIFVILTGLIIWLYFQYKFNKYILMAVLFIITAVDMLSVNKRYLNEDNFIDKKKATFTASPADNFILQDPDKNYRVANLAVSIFNDASTSYFHKSIGGYHGAKLKKYQEVIEFGITPELERIYAVLGGQGVNQQQVDNLLMNLHVLNMLNTKYFILNPQSQPLGNPYALGNAWFPSEIKWVDNADQEMAELQKINTRTTAVANNQFKDVLGSSVSTVDTVSNIVQTAYHPEKMEYTANATADKIAVFSEVWYPEGWKCYIDGKETPIGRANYILRAIKVPAGQHKIEFIFEPTFAADEKISLIISLILLLAIIGMVAKEVYPMLKNNSSVKTK